MESLDGPAFRVGVAFDIDNTPDGPHRELAQYDGSGTPSKGKDPEGLELRKISASQVLMLCCPRSFSEVELLVSFPSTQIKELDFFSLTSCGNPSGRLSF